MPTSVRVGAARIDFEGNDSGYQRVVTSVLRRQGQLRRDHDRTTRAVRAAQAANASLVSTLARVGTVAGLAGLGRLGLGAIRSASRIGKLADSFGVAVETLQEYRFAANQTGIAQRTFDIALQRATRRIGEAAAGTGEALKTFQELGISLRDNAGNIRSTEDVLADFADALAGTENQADRLRLAFKLFDSEGARLVNLFGRGSKAIEVFRQQARDTGQVLAEDLVRGAERTEDQLAILEGRLRVGFGTAVLSAVDNSNLLAGAAAAVGGVLAGRYASGVAIAIGQSRALARQERVTLDVLENAAARRATIAAQEARVLASQSPVRGFARLTQVEAQVSAQRRAAAATTVHAAAQRNLARATTLAGRAARAGSAALGFLGGPVGAVVTGLSLAAAAWLAFGRNAETASETAIESANRAAEAARANASALTPEGESLAAVEARIAAVRAALVNLYGEFDPTDTLQEGADLPNPRILRLEEELRQAAAARDALTAALTEKGSLATTEALTTQVGRLSLALTDPTRRARDLARALSDGTSEAEQSARRRIELSGRSGLAVEQQLAVQEALVRVEREQLASVRALADARQDSARADALVEAQRVLTENVALGTKERTEAEARLKTAQTQATAQRERLASLQVERGHLGPGARRSDGN